MGTTKEIVMMETSSPKETKEEQDIEPKGFWFTSKTDEEIEELLKTMLSPRNLVVLFIVCILSLLFLFPLTFIAPAAYFSFYFYTKEYLKTRKFMREYAKSRNLQYTGTLDIDSLTGRLFMRSRRKVEHVLVGEYSGFLITLFYYSYSVKEGKHTRVYPFTVSEITVGTTKFPHLLLLNNNMEKYQFGDYFGDDKDVKVGLGGDDSRYTLYTTNNYELEALQICTPEFVELLRNGQVIESVECAENKVYIYTDTRLTTKEELDVLYNTTTALIEKFGPFLIRLKDDYDSLHEVFKK
ncbi:MAG: UbiA prenyltransferase family protein [Candidatus Pacebacteria bacterium]|jgi:hypothetical protein|nr:UbiA prenyltransferase family protein [Candidatus Paceibacterota bacterium]